MKNRTVWVTGMGIICPKVKNCDEFSTMLKNGESCITKRQNSETTIPQLKIGGFYDEFSLVNYLKQENVPEEFEKEVQRICRRQPVTVQCTVGAAIAAGQSSGFLGKVDPEKVSILVAGSNIQQEMQASIFEKYEKKKCFILPDYASRYWDTSMIGLISEIFQIRGEGYTLGGASASGNVALIEAYRKIQAEDAEVCMVVGPMASLSEYELSAFANIGALGGLRYQEEPQSASRPFDRNHEGFIYGQGTGCIILESDESAKKRGAKGLAQFLGGAMRLDANHSTNASAPGEASTMKKALHQAGIVAEEVDYINAHGTSTPSGDYTELEAIDEVFRNQRPKINSTKCMVGHCLCSAGIIEAIATILQMQQKFIHGNIKLIEPIRKHMNLVGPASESYQIQLALSNSFGFAGINTSIVLKNMEV